MSRRRLAASVAALGLLSGALAACGSSDDGPDYALKTPPRYRGAAAISVPTPTIEWTMHAKDARRLQPVLEKWSTAVREGDSTGAARYFALPAIVADPATGPIEIRRRSVVEDFNRAFPCGTRLVDRAKADGRYIVGTFQLLAAPGRHCTTPNARVKVAFVFGDEKHPHRFTEWWRVAETPGAEVGPTQRPAAPIAGPDTFR